MNFSFNQRLNKNLILSNCSEEQIYAFYIGSHIITKKLFCSKLRRDKNPTCSLYKNKNGTLIYKDFATNDSLNCFGYVMSLFNCTYNEALKIIANDFNIIKDSSLKKNKGKIISEDFKIKEKEFSKIQVEIQDFTELELKYWEKFGITLDILKEFNVYSCKNVFLNGQLIAQSKQNCPIFGYYGGKEQEEELWRIYFPKRKEGRFIGNWPTKKIQGYGNLPNKGKLLVITKSMKDVMCLHSMGITACAPNSETQFLPDNVLSDLKNRFKYIVVLFDNDITGISFMNKLKKKYPDLLYTWIPRKFGAKDISDFHKLYKRKKTIHLISKFLKHIKKL